MITRVEERSNVHHGGRGSSRAAGTPSFEIRTAHQEIRPPRTAVCIPVLCLAALLASAPASRAEARWHLDLAAGVFSPLNNIDLSEDGFDLEIDLDTGGAFAVQGGYALDRWLDFTAGFHNGTHFDSDESVNVFSFTAGGRFFPLPMSSRFRPWLGAQIGWYGVDVYLDDFDYFGDFDDDLDEFEDSFGINAGGGFDIPINPRVSLGMDVRYHNAFDAFDGLEFVNTMFNVTIWFGDEPGLESPHPDSPQPHYPRSDSDTPPVPSR